MLIPVLAFHVPFTVVPLFTVVSRIYSYCHASRHGVPCLFYSYCHASPRGAMPVAPASSSSSLACPVVIVASSSPLVSRTSVHCALRSTHSPFAAPSGVPVQRVGGACPYSPVPVRYLPSRRASLAFVRVPLLFDTVIEVVAAVAAVVAPSPTPLSPSSPRRRRRRHRRRRRRRPVADAVVAAVAPSPASSPSSSPP